MGKDVRILSKDEMKSLLEEHPKYQDALFCRGYIITDDDTICAEEYPFYSKWKTEKIKQYNVFVHQNQDYIVYEKNDVSYLLIGHSYNPFNMVYNEKDLLEQLAEKYTLSFEEAIGCINEWTGIFALFIFDETVISIQDCAGIKGVIYGNVKGHTVFTSHAQLAGDLYDLTMDEFISKLVCNKYYNIGNRYLPGNLSQFKELHRLGANVYLEVNQKNEFLIKRFFPTEELQMIKSNEDYQNTIKKAFEILNNGLQLISKKWGDAHISLSGGTDSKTTLACANGLYDKFKYFSFESKDTEIIDANAASGICKKMGLEHKIFKIPSANSQIEDFDVMKKIIFHSSGYIRGLADHEVRKHIYFYNVNEIGVEVKSWISEIVRVFFDRKYGLRMPAKLTPRHFSIFQTRYFLSPQLLKQSDRIYKDFMIEFDLGKAKYNYEHTDLYYWEVRMSNWGMLVTTSLDICHKVTFPFNNRKLINSLLSIPREKRITDEMHNDIIKYANKDIYDMNVHIRNNYFKSKRIWLEKTYYYYRILLHKNK